MKTATKLKIVSFVEKLLGLKKSSQKYAKEVKVSRTHFLCDFKSKEAESDVLAELVAELEYQDLIKIKKYRDVRKWSFTKELDQMAQGKCSHKGTNTVKCIACSAMPAG